MNDNYIIWNLATCFSALLAAIYLFRYLLGKYLGKLHRQQEAMEDKLDQLLSAAALDIHTRQQIGHIDDIVASLERQLGSDSYENAVAEQDRRLAAISGKLDGIAKNAIDLEALNQRLTRANEGLERVLWMFRFDAQQFEKTNTPDKHNTVVDRSGTSGLPGKPGKAPADAVEGGHQHAGPAFGKRLSAEERDEVQKLQAVLDESKSSYDAMMEYMRLSGKGGYEALKLLKHAGAAEKDH